MAIFNIGDGYEIRSDSKQWVFASTGSDKSGSKTSSPIGYYTTIDGAIKGAYSYLQRKSKATTAMAFKSESEKILSTLINVFSPEIKITMESK